MRRTVPTLPSRCRREPPREVAHISFDVVEPRGMFPNRIAGRLGHKARTAFLDIPVVIGEMVKARFGHCSSKHVAVLVSSAFEGDRKVEWPACRQALTCRNDARTTLAARDADSTFMRMGREALDHAGRGARI